MASMDFEREKSSFREWYDNNIKLLADAEQQFKTLVTSLLSQSGSIQIDSVTSRVKDREECIRKFSRKYQTQLETSKTPYEIKDHITDLIGVRVVCLYVDEVAGIQALLADNFDLLDVSDKIASMEGRDDLFGYKGLHLDLKLGPSRVILPEYKRYEDLRFEVQVRTIVQDGWSVLDHKIKYKKNIPLDLRRRINRLAALFELADQEFSLVRDQTTSLEKLPEQPKLTPQVKVELEEPRFDGITPLVRPGAKYLHGELIEADEPRLDAFGFVSLAKKHWPTYPFLGDYVDGFVEEILKYDSEMTTKKLEQLIVEYLSLVDQYAKFQSDWNQHNLNPFTQIRHIVYIADKERFHLMLYDMQRANFNRWLSEKSNDLPANDN